jgi:hypothetical protein
VDSGPAHYSLRKSRTLARPVKTADPAFNLDFLTVSDPNTLANRFQPVEPLQLNIPLPNARSDRSKSNNAWADGGAPSTASPTFAIIWSYLSTATKHGLDHLDVLVEIFTTGPWLPPEPAPG